MLSLIIETSTECSLIALFEDDHLLHEYHFPQGIQEMHAFVATMENAFETCGKTSKELSYVAVGCGPGSFTGTRIGVVVGQTLAFACRIPIIGFFSQQAFIPDQEGPFTVITDAKMGAVYLMKGEKRSGNIQYFLEPERCSLETVEVSSCLCPKGSALAGIQKIPDSRHLHRIALEKYQKGDYNLEAKLQISYPQINP